MFNLEAWEDRLFAFGRFLRTAMFFYLIVKLVIGIFYRIDPTMVAEWFEHELEYHNRLALIFFPGDIPIDTMFGGTFSAIMTLFKQIPVVSFILSPIIALFSLEHTIWYFIFGPTASLQKDLILTGFISIFLYVLLKSKTKRGSD